MKQNIDIAFTINDSYAQHCCVVIASILYNNQHSNFTFHIITDYISEQNRKRILSVINRFSGQNSLKIVSVDNAMFEGLKLNIEYITLHTYYRLLMTRILPDIDKVLYLDSDIVVDGNLAELWNTQMDGALCLGARDFYIDKIEYKKSFGFAPDELYVNAGVLLMDLKAMRTEHTCEKMMEVAQSKIGEFSFQDQDVINWALRGRIKQVSAPYNFTEADAVHGKDNYVPIIVHYTGAVKPWNIYIKCQHTFADKYFKYLKMTHYRSFLWKFRLGRIDRRIKKILGKDLHAIK